LEFRDISRVAEPITAKRMKIDPFCQQQNCSPLNVLFSDVLISQDVPQLGGGGVKQRWDGKNKKQVSKRHTRTRLSRAYLAL